MGPCRLVLISGSPRDGSTNTAALSTVGLIADAAIRDRLAGAIRALRDHR